MRLCHKANFLNHEKNPKPILSQWKKKKPSLNGHVFFFFVNETDSKKKKSLEEKVAKAEWRLLVPWQSTTSRFVTENS